MGTNPYLSGLIASFYTDRPVEPNLVLHWDLSAVLNALLKSSFKSKDPAASVPLKFLTFMLVFLLSLASGARRGEIHALDVSGLWWSPDYKVTYPCS